MSHLGKIWAGAVVLLMGVVFSTALGQYGGGMGTAGEPYEIGTAEHLIFMGGDPNNWDKHFILTADIDLGVHSFTKAVIAPDLDNTNGGFDGPSFTGVFDGAGHQVMNLTIDGGANDFLGLFGMIGDEQAEVKNLGLENVSIIGALESEYLGGLCGRNRGTISRCYANGLVRGGSVVGGLCGHNRYGTISQCGAEGSVRGRRLADSVGGLCGQNYRGTITRCYATGSVSGADYSENIGGLCGTNVFGTISQCYATGSVSGGDFSGSHGGLCGGNYEDSTISDCYATGSVTGGYNSWYIGGLCGFNNSATIFHCYATGAVLGGTNSQNLGGFCGDNFRGEIRRCFFDVETGGPVNGLGKWLPTELMQTASTFIDAEWDFVTPIWFIREGEYPRLLWEIEMVEAALKLTPRTLNCRSQGKWVKAHLVLPEGYAVEDIDTDKPATLQPLGLTSAHLEVSVNEKGLVKVNASFDREAFCGAVGDLSEGITVYGYFADGSAFYGTASVRIITPGLEELAELAAYWLEEGCNKPHWCGGLDLNRDSVVNMLDFVLFGKSEIEFIDK